MKKAAFATLIITLLTIPFIFSSYRTGKMRIPPSVKKRYQPKTKKFMASKLAAWYRSKQKQFSTMKKEKTKKYKDKFFQLKNKTIEKRPANWGNAFARWFGFGQLMKKY